MSQNAKKSMKEVSPSMDVPKLIIFMRRSSGLTQACTSCERYSEGDMPATFLNTRLK